MTVLALTLPHVQKSPPVVGETAGAVTAADDKMANLEAQVRGLIATTGSFQQQLTDQALENKTLAEKLETATREVARLTNSEARNLEAQQEAFFDVNGKLEILRSCKLSHAQHNDGHGAHDGRARRRRCCAEGVRGCKECIH